MNGRLPRRVLVRAVNVPDALYRVPVSLEIVAPSGATKRAVLLLHEGEETDVPVPSYGNYLVRTRLPSGKWVSASALVAREPSADSRGEAGVGVARLDFGGVAARDARRDTPPALETTALPSRFAADSPLLTFAAGADEPGADSGEESVPSRTPRLPARFRFGFFAGWNDAGAALRLEPAPPSSLDGSLPGDLTLEGGHPGAAGDTAAWRPVLVRVHSDGDDGPADALIVWPPGHQFPPRLSLLPDQGVPTRAGEGGAPLLAFSESGDRAVDALFAYMRGNDLNTAREVAPDVVRQAQNYLAGKQTDPVVATLGAYVLLKIGNDARQAWVANLANWFPHLPDGAVLHGWFLIHGGKADEARQYFHEALRRGIPMYSEGVRLLQDGLGFLRRLYPDDAEVQADADLAYRLAASANLGSDLTCLRLDRGVTARFPDE